MIEPRLTLDELGDAFGSEVVDALETGRRLEAAIDETTRDLPATATGFDVATEARGDLADRVMAALADEPAPAPAGFLLPLRRRGILRGLWASVRQASVAMRGGGRPLLARGAALAYVLAIAVAGVSLTGAATIGAAGALGMLGPAATESVAPSPPGPTTQPPQPPLPTPTPSIPPVLSPSPPPSPSESPEESDDHGSGAEPSDHSGGYRGPGGGDGSSGGSDDSSGSLDGSSGGSDDSSSSNSGPGSSTWDSGSRV